MPRVKHKYHYFYKITNNLNNHFYYGVHSTDNLEDGYMGSGTRLHYAYKKYGIENFTKEILKFFDTREKANEYEAEIVNEELIKDENCYNVVKGGAFDISGMVTVRNKDGKCYLVSLDDPRYLSGELVSFWVNRKHKPETIEKVKQTYKNIKHQQGEKNSQYGTCWIYNDKESIKIKKEDLEKYLAEGWIKGRKMKF